MLDGDFTVLFLLFDAEQTACKAFGAALMPQTASHVSPVMKIAFECATTPTLFLLTRPRDSISHHDGALRPLHIPVRERMRKRMMQRDEGQIQSPLSGDKSFPAQQ